MVKFRLPKTREPGLARFVTNAVTILKRVFVRPLLAGPSYLKFSSNLNFSTLMKNFVEFVQKPHWISNNSFNHVC